MKKIILFVMLVVLSVILLAGCDTDHDEIKRCGTLTEPGEYYYWNLITLYQHIDIEYHNGECDYL